VTADDIEQRVRDNGLGNRDQRRSGEVESRMVDLG
jgi:hypothetical protein